MNETNHKFPEKWRSKGDYGEIDVYSKNAVDDWFQRCIEDFPKTADLDSYDNLITIHRTQEDFVRWFLKWFSQFRDKGDI